MTKKHSQWISHVLTSYFNFHFILFLHIGQANFDFNWCWIFKKIVFNIEEIQIVKIIPPQIPNNWQQNPPAKFPASHWGDSSQPLTLFRKPWNAWVIVNKLSHCEFKFGCSHLSCLFYFSVKHYLLFIKIQF